MAEMYRSFKIVLCRRVFNTIEEEGDCAKSALTAIFKPYKYMIVNMTTILVVKFK